MLTRSRGCAALSGLSPPIDGTVTVTNGGSAATVGLAIEAELYHPPEDKEVKASSTVDASAHPILQPKAEFNASKLESGMYFYRLQAGENIATKNLLLVK